eukprot:16062359-Heterocapsa_arctica.AAC.1
MVIAMFVAFCLSVSHRRQSDESADGKKNSAPSQNRWRGAKWALLRRGQALIVIARMPEGRSKTFKNLQKPSTNMKNNIQSHIHLYVYTCSAH